MKVLIVVINHMICFVYHIGKVDGCNHITLRIIPYLLKMEGSVHDIGDGPIASIQHSLLPNLSVSTHIISFDNNS